MLRRGHTVENHTHRHPAAFACRGPWALRREVGADAAAVADATGVAPRFFRAPMGLRSPLLDPVLALEGLALVSWTRRGYDTPAGAIRQRVLGRLTRGLAGRDILLLHDGAAGARRGGRRGGADGAAAAARRDAPRPASARRPWPRWSRPPPRPPQPPGDEPRQARQHPEHQPHVHAGQQRHCRARSGNARRRPPRRSGSAPAPAGSPAAARPRPAAPPLPGRSRSAASSGCACITRSSGAIG